MASGDTLTDSDFSGDRPLTDSDFSSSVSYPSEIPAKLKSVGKAAVQAIPPALANVAGSYGGAMGGAALGGVVGGPPGALIGGALGEIGGAGAANVASSKLLPESLGGNPKASKTSDFLWGAVPQALSFGAKTGANAFLKHKLGSASKQFMEQGRQNILDATNMEVQDQLQRPPTPIPIPLEDLSQPAALRTAQADQMRAPILQVIRQARNKYGSRIGQAYQSLKGDQALSTDEADALTNRFEGLQQGQIAPDPLGQKYLRQLKAMREDPEKEALRAQMSAQGAPQKMIDSVLNQMPQKEVKLDQLRNMWQQMGQDLDRTGQGGNIHALREQRRAIDDVLGPYLPPEMQQWRKEYHGFMQSWDYDRDKELMGLRDPQDIMKATFKNPADAYELATEANPAQLDKLRDNFVQYVWGDLPVKTAPGKELAAKASAKLAPYIEDSKAGQAMLGQRSYEIASHMVSWAKYGPELSQALEKDPHTRELFQKAYDDYFLRQGLTPKDATKKAMGLLMAQNPGAANILEDTPFLPSSRSGGRQSMAPLLAARHGGMALLHLGMGNVGWAGFQGAEAAMWMSGGHGFNAAAKMGVTRAMLNAFQQTNPLKAGWWFAKAMNSIPQYAAQYARQTLPVEQNDTP